MNNIQTISKNQLALLTSGCAVITSYTFMPALQSPPYNQDIWVTMLFAFVIALFFNIPFMVFGNKLRNLDATQVNELILGKILGRIFSFIFGLILVYCVLGCTLHAISFVKAYLYHLTPIWAILIMIVLPVAYASIKGAGIIGRVGMVLFSFVMFTIIMFFVMGIKDMDLNFIRPILADSKVIDIVKGSFYNSTRFFDTLILYVFWYHTKRSDTFKSTFFLTLSGMVIFLSMMYFPVLTVLGYDVANLAVNPYYTFSRQVGGADFIQRVQGFNAMAWLMGTLLKLSTYVYAASIYFKGAFKFKNRKFYACLIIIIASLICLIPFMNKDETISHLVSDNLVAPISAPVIFGMPTILLIVYLIRRKKLHQIVDEQSNEAWEEESSVKVHKKITIN